MATTETRNNSREPQAASRARTEGRILDPKNSIAARNAAPLTSASPSSGRPSPTFFRTGNTVSSGTIARSWTMSIPTMTLLERVPRTPCSVRVLRTTAVLEKESRAPSHTDSTQPRSRITRPKTYPKAIVSTIWIGVPIRAMRRTGASSRKEKCNPIVNSRSATPISARSSIWWTFPTEGPKVFGPTRTPAAM